MPATKHRYRIRYRDEDPGCPVFTWTCRAWNAEDAIERFEEGPDGEGWKLLGIQRIDEEGRALSKEMALDG